MDGQQPQDGGAGAPQDGGAGAPQDEGAGAPLDGGAIAAPGAPQDGGAIAAPQDGGVGAPQDGGAIAANVQEAPNVQAYVSPKLSPPDKFNFNDSRAWSRWSARWSRYREASGLSTRPDREQITTFIYTMGEQAEDVLLSRGIPENNYLQVLAAFNNYFGVRTNVITERAKFNRLTQGTDSMDMFINRLYRQAEYCQYGALREELLRDRLVVGVVDDRLSEKLQSQPDLTLDQAVQMSRRHEAAKQAQSVIREGTTPRAQVDAFKTGGSKTSGKGSCSRKPTKQQPVHAQRDSKTKVCIRCGREPHKKEVCPARNSECNKCKRLQCIKLNLRLLVGVAYFE